MPRQFAIVLRAELHVLPVDLDPVHLEVWYVENCGGMAVGGKMDNNVIRLHDRGHAAASPIGRIAPRRVEQSSLSNVNTRHGRDTGEKRQHQTPYEPKGRAAL